MKQLQDDSPLFVKIIKVAAFLIVTGFIMYFAFFRESAEPHWWWSTINPGTKEYSTDLYWRFHPLMWWDVIGLILLEAGLFAIIGVWSLFLGVFHVNKPDGYGWAAWVIAALGVVLIMINPTSL